MNVWHYAPIKQQWKIQRGGTVGAVAPYWLKFFLSKKPSFSCKRPIDRCVHLQ